MLLIFLLLAVTAYGSFLYLHRPTGIWTVAVFGVDSRDGNTKKRWQMYRWSAHWTEKQVRYG